MAELRLINNQRYTVGETKSEIDTLIIGLLTDGFVTLSLEMKEEGGEVFKQVSFKTNNILMYY